MKKTYTKAVSATLASALAVGMVPAMALADETADQEMDLLLANDESAAAGGTIVVPGYEAGAKVEVGSNDLDELFPAYVTAANSGDKLDIVKVYWVEKNTVENDSTKSTHTFDGDPIYTTGNWKQVTAENWDTEQPTAPGDYYMAVYVDSAAEESDEIKVIEAFPFTVTAKSLDGAYLYTDADGDDIQDATEGTTFTYNGKDQFNSLALSLGVGDKTLAKGEDYTLTIVSAVSEFQNAGEYVVRIKGTENSEYDGYSKDVKVTMGTLNLAEAAIELDQNLYAQAGTLLPTDVKLVNKNDIAGLSFTLESATTGQLASPESLPGKYVYRVAVAPATATTPANTNIVNYQDITAVRYGAPAVIKYDGKAASNAEAYIDAENPFDPDAISVIDNAKDKNKLPFTVTYTKADETVPAGFVAVEEDEITLPGTYTAKIVVNDSTYAYGGTEDITFTVDALKPAANQTYVYYNDVLKGDDFGVQFTGSDILEDIDFKVMYKGEELVKGTDYDLKVTCDGDVVTEIVNVEDYVITVVPAKGSMYEFDGDFDIKVSVTAVTPLKVRVADQVTVMQEKQKTEDGKLVTYTDEVTGLAYTGEVIVPSFEYYTQDDLTAAIVAAQKKYNDDELDGDDAVVLDMVKWHALPADVFTYTIDDPGTVAQKADGKIQELGEYDFAVKTAKKVVNYNLTGLSDEITEAFQVINGSIFKDVFASDWYCEVVNEAANLNYMNGIGGSLFAPSKPITRGQVVCTLFNMAGEKSVVADGMTNETLGFKTGFSDVDPNAYYAEAILWAEKADIANGHDGKFRPEDTVTREELAAFLCNYAEIYLGADHASDADAVLASFPDGAKVSGWAEGCVAWAASEKVMGNGGVLNPQGTATRAEMAAMAVNLQPQKLA